MPEPQDDPFKKIQEELSRMEVPDDLPEENLSLEDRVRRAMSEHELTPDEEVELRLQGLSDGVTSAAKSTNPEPEDFDERLSRLEGTARAAREKRERIQREEDKRLRSDGATSRGLGYGMTVAYMIVGTPLMGLGIGWLIDRSTGADFWKGIGTVIGAVLGVGAALFVLNRNESK